MNRPSRLATVFALALSLNVGATAQTAAQTAAAQEAKTNTPQVTATATAERVRFAAHASVVQLRLEVYDETGRKLFDTEQRGGNVLDWHLLDGAGQRAAEG